MGVSKLIALAAIALGVVGAATACGIDGVGVAPPDGGAREIVTGAVGPGSSGDGATVTSDGNPSVTSDDPGIDAGDDAAVDSNGCKVISNATFASLSPRWQMLGLAKHVAATSDVELTPASSAYQGGAVYWNTPITFRGSLRVAVEYTFETLGDVAGDGMAVVWIDTSTPYVLGEFGLNYGVCNKQLVGNGIALDVLRSKLIALSSVANTCGTNTLTNYDVSESHRVVVDIAANRIAGKIDTTTIALNGNYPKTGYLGVTASTGTGGSRTVVHAVRIADCP